ncbi:MAG: hypothetical protein JSU92_13890 [Deltaproteobacteria bacterium]|nr:MAG: hypothetical protein JSU92_13890 [Deltaproteobacteria bacterium]
MGDEEDISRLENDINHLKFEYEQYFMGMEKIEPIKKRENVERFIRTLSTRVIRNTALRFRLSALTARYNTYLQYWIRIVRQIEEGTYQRDKFRSQLKQKLVSPASPGMSDKEGRAAPAGGFQDVYQQYLEAKKKCKEDTSSLSLEKLTSTLQHQTTQIKEKYKCKDVDFKVVIEAGKTKLKAIPKN